MTETRSVRVRISASLSGLKREFAEGAASVEKFDDRLERLTEANLNLERAQIKVSQAQKTYDKALQGSDVDKQRAALNDLNRANLEVERSTRKVTEAQRELERSSDRSGSAFKRFADDLDRTDQRMSGLLQTGLALGPALVPVLAGTTVAAAGAATAVTALAAAGGTVALAFAGVGDALTALNDYKLDPTAENLEKVRAAMTELGPAGADFVRYLQTLRPELDGLQSIARQGLFPGMEQGIDQVKSQLPLVEDIVGNVASALGDVAREGGQALSGPFWTQFLEFVRSTSGPALTGMAEGFGNIAEGMAGLTMAFGPSSADLGGALLNMSEAFDQWGKSVGHTQGFHDFIDYLSGVGPEVGDTLAAVGNALVQVAQAAAPIGGVSLAIIRGLANTLSAIANIPVVGPALIGAAAGIAAVSRAVSLYKAAGLSSMVSGLRGIDSEGKKASTAMTAVSRGGVALTAAMVGVEVIQNIGKALDETLPGMNELQNRMQELASGQVATLGPQFDSLGESIDRVANPRWYDKTLEFAGLPDSSEMRQAKAEINAIDTALSDLVTSKSPEAARRMFASITEGMNPAQVKDFLSVLPGYRDAMAGVGQGGHLAAEGLSAASRAAQQLTRDMAQLTGALDRRSAMRAYQESIDAVNKSIKENGKTLDADTAKGRANADVLDNIARSGAAYADTLHGLAKIRVMQQTRKDFIGAAMDMGRTRVQARGLADDVHLVNQKGKIQVTLKADGLDKATQDLNRVKQAADRVPKRIDARVQGDTGDAERDLSVVARKLKDLDSDSATPKASLRDDASRKINAVQGLMRSLAGSDANPSATLRDNASGGISHVSGLLSALDGRTATTTVINRTVNIVEGRSGTPIRLPSSAMGNLFESYAGGDVRNHHQPEIARPGTYRLWAEDETGGESYIPHANDHRRGRAIDIWERTGDILGVRFARLAEGGLTDKERERRQAAREREHGLASGLRQFRVADDLSGMRSELRDFRRTLAEAFGHHSDILKAFGHLDEKLEKNARQAQKLTKAHENLTNQMRDLRSQRQSLEQSVASNFLSSEAFGGGMADLSLWLSANRNDANRMSGALKTLGHRGASDSFLRQLAESGNFDLAQELAHSSNRELRQIYEQFSQQRHAAAAVGNLAGAQVLGDEMKRTSRHLRDNNRAISHNTRQMRHLGRTLERRVRQRAGGAHRRARGG